MRKVKEIAELIRNLTDAEVAEFREWYAEFERFRGNVADADADGAWLEEVQRRSAEFDTGRVEIIPAEQAFARVRARLKR